MSVLVTGGAGYIGAHVVRALAAGGDRLVVVDDLSTGIAARVGDIPLVQIDLTSSNAVEVLTATMHQHRVDAVIHLAAKKQVAESVARPAHYFRQNVGGLANLLEAMQVAEVAALVFSSSAAAFGNPREAAHGPVDESVAPVPISPYGETKLVGEWLCHDAARAWGLRWCALRYFNVVGAGAEDLGDVTAQNLVPLVFEAIERGQPPVVYGDDYPTPDGTCVRDYVHVSDVADAHLSALTWLDTDADGAIEPVFNVGTGTGSSVRDVLAAIMTATERELNPTIAGRRSGDPATLVADVHRIETHVGWRSRHSLLDAVKSAWAARQAQEEARA